MSDFGMKTNVPMFTAKGSIEGRVEGLEWGAED